MRATISDTSPLQYLYQADALSLLPQLFGKVFVPEAVPAEVRAGREAGVLLPDLEALPWVSICRVQAQGLLPLVTQLGAGEKEVLALGLETPGSLLVLDDRQARRHAGLLSLRVTGTLGVLLLARERGYVSEVRPVLDRLDDLHFRVSESTREIVLRLAKELP